MKKYLAAIVITALILAAGCGKSPSRQEMGPGAAGEGSTASSDLEKESGDQKKSAEEKTEEKTKEKTKKDSKDTSENEKDRDQDLVQLMPNVTGPMQSADYWIDKMDHPDQVILSRDEIRDFNQKIQTEKAEIRKFQQFAEEQGQRAISREDLRAWLDETEVPEETCSVDGKVVGQAYWDRLKANQNYEAIRDENPVRYGFAVDRITMRGFPSADRVYTGDRFTFFDEIQLSALLTGEPLILAHTSRDKKWAFVITRSCTGWVPIDGIALSDDYESWKADSDPERFLIVTGDEIYLEYDPEDPDVSNRHLTMGAKLPLVPAGDHPKSAEGREAYGNYVIKLPCRKKDGGLVWKYAFVPMSREVSVGYPELTARNLLTIAFDCLGNRYGWGGLYDARDCSLYIMELYRCFGILLPRNTTGFSAMKADTVDVEGLTDAQKEKALKDIPPGSILCMPSHASLYLGKEGGNDYVISATAAPIPDGQEKRVDVQSVIINDLHAAKKDGISWLTHTEKIKKIQ